MYNNCEDPGEGTSTNLTAALSELKSSKFYDKSKLLPSPSKVAAAASSTGPARSLGGPILVSPRQRGNPLLQFIRKAPWQYEEGITADYVPNTTTGVLYLSLKYHGLSPDYIHERLKLLAKNYELRILLVQVDCPDPHYSLKSLTRICLLADLTMMVAWSAEEAGHIIETYKVYENKPADMIMERIDSDPYSKVVSSLSSIRSVNKTDSVNLLSTLGSISKITNTKLQDLELCPGLGPQKASKLYSVLHQPFLKDPNTRKKQQNKNIIPSTSSDS